jgi:hypothetical protein
MKLILLAILSLSAVAATPFELYVSKNNSCDPLKMQITRAGNESTITIDYVQEIKTYFYETYIAGNDQGLTFFQAEDGEVILHIYEDYPQEQVFIKIGLCYYQKFGNTL